MKRQVFAQVRPLDDAGQESGVVLADGWDDGEEPSPLGVRWMVKLDDWYLTPPVGFIPLTRVVH
jgi:hypothetical protein